MRKFYSALLLLFFISKAFSQNYTILGNSSSMGGCNCFRLTPDADDQAGAIFQNQTINLNNSFDFTFNVFLGCNGSNGADGIVFVLTSNPNGLGNAGEGMGYAGGNQPFSLAVEFDTWQNGNAGDPSFDHIGIESGGLYSHNVAGPVSALTSQGNIDNCGWHTVRIVWDVNTNTYSVYFDGVLRQQVVIPNMVNTYFGGNPIVNWGWSGATGGGSNDQQVCVLNTSNWVAGINYQSCSTTMQFNDISTSSLGSIQSWAWNFGDNTTSTLQNPSHTYASLGTYTVTLVVTDISGCTNTYTHPVTINSPIVLTPALSPPPCNGGSNGNIAVTPSGGFGPSAGYGGYTYLWNTGMVGPNLVGVTAGTYIVTATDGVCTTTAQYTINQPPPLTATTSHTDASCGANNGSVTITLFGGTQPYQPVTWTGGFVGTTVTGLAAGLYIADPHDANGCSALLQYRETVGSLPCGYSLTTSSTNVSCFGGSNGTVTVTPTGGGFPWSTTWTPGGPGNTITGLSAGTYNYSTNNGGGGQVFSGSVTLTQPGAAMASTMATIDMSCANTNDGQATASVISGGTSPYSYAWSRGTPNGAITTGLSPGPISVVITDANGCTATASGNITGPPTLTLNVTSIDDSCFQSETGSATANVSGGNPPYQFFWSNISSAQTNLSLGVGTYTVTVTDDKGCTITGSATINQPTLFSHTLSSTNILCAGNATGTITITPSGGTPGYSYAWNPASVSGGTPTGLAAGQYNVTISDGNNCQRLDSVILTEPANGLVVTTSHTDATCFGANNGTLTITISGGTPPYNFGGIPVPPGTTTIPGLPDSTYAGSIADATGCSVPVSETISEPPLLSLSETHIDAICNGASNGSIDLTATGGTGSYTFNWSDGPTTEDRTNLFAGTYIVTCTDLNSCTATLTITVSEPPAPVMTVTTVDAVCFGGNGSATANPVGGGPFTYTWSVGGTTPTITPPAGTHTVSASDVNSCNQTATFTINQPPDITIAEVHTDLLCFGDADGTINLTPSGGTGASYTYIWSPNVSSSNTASLLPAGDYIITVTDAAGCPKVDTVTLTQPALPVTLNIQSNNITCFGLSNGSITITATGGTGGYTYTWNPNVTSTNSASGLTPGTYVITVADANNCSVIPIVTISEPNQPLTLVKDSTNLTCFQSNNGAASVVVSGGTFPYSYAWSPNTDTTGSVTSLSANVYTLTVTDDNACVNITTFNITEPPLLVSSETHVDVLCFGNTTGSILVAASGGTPGYTYTWSPNVSSVDSAVNIPAGIYSVTVADTNGCTVVQPVTVSEPPLLTLNPVVTDVLCNGGNTGAIDAGVAGGVLPYSFSASDGTNTFPSSSGIFTSLVVGSYTITVTDQNACVTTASATVNEPLPLTDVLDTFPAVCYHYADGSILVSVAGGTVPYSISLSNGATNSTGLFNGLSAGTYSVSIIDANGCPLSDIGVITEPDSVFVSISPTPVEVKLGETVQLATVTNQGGTLTYSWTPTFGLSCYDCANPVFGGVYSQPYLLVVTNQDGCVGTSQFVVTVIPNYDVFIPNVFTPDGNGNNDTWQIFGNMSAIKQLQVAVFNRWGEKVFEGNDINFKWDGTYKGEKVPAGVYVYTAKFVWLNNHSDNDYTGSITVLH